MSRASTLAGALLLCGVASAAAQQTTIDSGGLMKGINESKQRFDEVRKEDEEARQRRAAQGGNSPIVFVRVELEIICVVCANDRRLSISGGPGRVEKGAVAYVQDIHPRGSALAGTYSYLATWNNGRNVCSGRFNLSGTMRTFNLRLHTSCSDGGSREM